MRFFFRVLFYPALYCAVCLLLLQPGDGRGDLHLWPEWYTLVTREGAETEKLLQGSVPFLSPSSLPVRVNGFDGDLSVALADLPERFSPEDPRIDPFLKSLHTLFEARWDGQRADVIYVERTVPAERLAAVLAEAGPESEVLIADRLRSSRLPLLILFAAAAVPVILLQRRSRLLSVLVLLPWGLGIFASGEEAAFLALLALFILPRLISLVLPFLIRRLREPETVLEPSVRFEAGILAAGMIVGMALYGIRASFFGFLRFPFSAALAALALVRLRLIFEEYRLGRLLHPLFLPLPLRPRPEKKLPPFLQAFFAASAMAAAVLIPGSVPGDLELPLPVAADFNPRELESSLAGLSAMEEGGLPSLPLYLTHRYFQENYLYAPGFTLPSLGAGLEIDNYEIKEGRIVSSRSPVWRFTSQWYEDIIADDTDRIIHFFIQEGLPVGIGRSQVSETRAPVYGLYPGLGLLFSICAAMLGDGIRRRREFGRQRIESRSMSQTA
jgi:hypothetical protein